LFQPLALAVWVIEMVGLVVSFVRVLSALAPVFVAVSMTHTRRVFAPSLRLPAETAVATLAGCVE